MAAAKRGGPNFHRAADLHSQYLAAKEIAAIAGAIPQVASALPRPHDKVTTPRSIITNAVSFAVQQRRTSRSLIRFALARERYKIDIT